MWTDSYIQFLSHHNMIGRKLIFVCFSLCIALGPPPGLTMLGQFPPQTVQSSVSASIPGVQYIQASASSGEPIFSFINPFSTGINFWHQKSIPALKEINISNGRKNGKVYHPYAYCPHTHNFKWVRIIHLLNPYQAKLIYLIIFHPSGVVSRYHDS